VKKNTDFVVTHLKQMESDPDFGVRAEASMALKQLRRAN
jgi:hypothetical protein